ncbi:MAG: phosphonopyruvate decarboxylase [Candidatus Hodarchaeales archaeon]
MKCEELWQIFERNRISFFTGVPDSTFKEWTKFLAEQHNKQLTNVVACNECEAIAIASGYYLATNNIAVAYMQNAGEGKTVNPITSICSRDVYSIPVFLMIGWRGEPGIPDEPQHKTMGKITISLLELMDIPYEFLPKDKDEAKEIIKELKEKAINNSTPVAVIIKKGTFEKYDVKEIDLQDKSLELLREEAIKSIIDNIDQSTVIISTTGKTSRELYEYRVARKETPKDFYTVGGMGCSASIGFGIALEKRDKKILVLDGDGSILMQLGTLATIGHYSPENFYHIIFDNRSHESTGGQPTVSETVDFATIAESCNYRNTMVVVKRKELIPTFSEFMKTKGPSLLVVKVKKGSRSDLGRPTTTPYENKQNFMRILNE